jgi:hypothetical protein
MSAERSDKSHAMAWTLSILSALVLYVLSIGPVDGLITNSANPRQADGWFPLFYRPIFWLTDNTPLEKVEIEYRAWWWKATKR